MELLVFLVLALGVAVGCWVAIALRERGRAELHAAELRFGSDLTVDQVEAVLAAVAGLPLGAPVAFEASADEGVIYHRLEGPAETLDLLIGQLRAVVPSLRIEPVEPAAWTPTAGAELHLSGPNATLRREASVEAAASVLGALTALRAGERLVLRWVLQPARRTPGPSAPLVQVRPPSELMAALVTRVEPSPEQLRAQRAKLSGPVLAGVAVVAAGASTPERAEHLVARVVAVARSRGGAYGNLKPRRRRPAQLGGLLAGLPNGRDHYAPQELVGLLGWPAGAPHIPGLTLGAAPQLLPETRLPESGRVLGVSNWPGLERPIAQPVIGAMSHALIVGPTGVGKSSMLVHLIAQDMAAGRGAFVLDPKGDLAEDVLGQVPASRIDDVIVLDPASGSVPGLRMFGAGSDPELAADLVAGVMADLHPDNWGVLSEKWATVAIRTLAHDTNPKLADFSRLFSDRAYRQSLIARLDDPLLEATWASFEAMSPRAQAHQISALRNKMDSLLSRRAVRGVISQSAPKLDMADVLARAKIVVASLPAGRIGAPAARLLGALVLHELFLAVQGRAALPPEKRQPYLSYIDEPALLKSMPVPLDSVFEVARGLGVGLTLAAQTLTQLPEEVRAAAVANAGTIVAFRQAASDAQFLARELDGVEPEHLQGLEAFEIVTRLTLGPGDVARPVTGRTLPPAETISDADEVRRRSAELYGVPLETVDEELRSRSRRPQNRPPVGRVRRAA